MTGIVDFRTSLTDKLGGDIDALNPLPVTGGGGGGGENPIDPYLLNDFEDATPLYLGKAKSDGTWLVQRYNSGTGEMRYANLSNNAGLVYATAWSGRVSLSYALFQTLTGV
jgi:hypothetical protein